MAFLEQRLTDAVARGSRGGPTGRRTKTYVQSGALAQKFERSLPLHVYDISFGIKTLDDFEAVRAMFYVVMFTPYLGFRMRDWNDYKGTRTNTTLTSLGGGTWQLKRRYTIGAINFDRVIKKPNSDVVAYDAGGSPLTTSVDTATGIATITGTPASWVGTFDVPVTFVDDKIDSIALDGIAGHELQGLSSIRLEEIRLP
jgi:uncharacterized protein (TIGR02217 family)